MKIYGYNRLLENNFIMNRRIRNIAAGIAGFALNLSGFVERARRGIKDGCILPIYFHNPSGKLFKNIIHWLKDNRFFFISTKDLIDIIKRPKYTQKKLVWITFDDGWRDNLDNIIPTLIEYDIPATFFISTYPAKTSGFFWWTAVNRFKKKLPEKYRSDISEIWRRPWPEIEAVIKELIRNEKTIPREAMTIQEIIDISKLPQVTIGGHGVHHLITKHSSNDELISELIDSKIALENWIKMPVKYFSYPRGIYSQRDKPILKECGYELAASTENYLISNSTDLYAVPRFTVFDEAYYYEALCRVVGIWEPFTSRLGNWSSKKWIPGGVP